MEIDKIIAAIEIVVILTSIAIAVSGFIKDLRNRVYKRSNRANKVAKTEVME